MTSGPCVAVGAWAPDTLCTGGMVTPLSSPLTSSLISTGCMAAPIEISPTTAPDV